MPFVQRTPVAWQLRSRSLDLGKKTVVMGILNVTPDSFSEGGRFREPQAAIEQGLAMFEQGAAIVDIGGESTRPGQQEPVSAQEEIDRVLPVIGGILLHRPESILSIDTYKSETARAAVEEGAEIVNDVSGFLWDTALAATSAKLGCGVVLTHTRGRPGEWRNLPPLAPQAVVPLVRSELADRASTALAAGIMPQKIVLDPGFGFGKSFGENYPLLAHLDDLRALGFPLLAGVSRKSFLARALAPLRGGVDAPVAERENATLAATVAAILSGADLVRVHTVRPALEAAMIADAILAAL
jgi:dihydropteroate synthase